MALSIDPASREDWKQLREKLVITASRIGCLFGKHPYTSQLREYQVAVGEAARDEEAVDQELVDLGNDAELIIPGRVQRLDPQLLLEKNARLVIHPRLPFGGTPDFLSPDLDAELRGKKPPKRDYLRGQCWQAKCLHPMVWHRAWERGATIPDWILLQLQTEMLLTGATAGGIIVLVRDAEWSTHLLPVAPHTALHEAIEDAVSDFRDAVRNRKPPAADYELDGEWIMESAPPPAEAKAIDLTGDNLLTDAFTRFHEAHAAEADAAKRKAAAKAEIIQKMGDAQIVTCGPFKAKRTPVAAIPDTTITADMVGNVVKGRKGYVLTTISGVK